jgi:hypothetical protein
MPNKKIRHDRGFVLITLLASTFAIMLTGVITTQLVLSNLKVAISDQSRLAAQFSADAAIDHALQEINLDETWTGTSGGSGSNPAELTLYEDTKQKVTFESTIVNDPDPFVKYIDVIGRTYTPVTDPTPKNIRKYRAELRGVGGGNYSIVTGVGGLSMQNSARIVDGSVHVNGEIIMSNTAAIGLSINNVNVNVSHQVCPVPADSNYPVVCTPGENGEPITLNDSAHIYGAVKGTNQVNGAGMSDPGLQPGSPEPISLPEDNTRRLDQIDAVVNTINGSDAGCSSGTKTWTANTKILGDVLVRNSCDVVVEGDVWITGNLTVRNTGSIKVKEGLTDPPVIMIDGTTGIIMQNAGALLPNTALKGFRVITYHSVASCSPDCSDVTGVNLFNSQSITTVSLRNSANASFTEFYSRWTKIDIENSGNVGALVGQQIAMSNAAAVTFGASVTGLNTPNAWVLRSYKRVF